MKEETGNLRKAVLDNPGDAAAHYNLGLHLAELRHYTESLESLTRASALMPTEPRIHNALGFVLNKQGRNAEAIACFRRALRLEPGFVTAHDNLVYYLHFEFDCSPEAMYREHHEWNKRHAIHLRPPGQYHNVPDPARRLRVGYVSADFRVHSVARFLEPLLSAHDRNTVEVYCYANSKRTDHVTARLAAHAAHWRDICDLDDDALAQLIRSDQIDILIDLGGHTANNRLGMFARKPAPLQISWLGYPDTTGLTGIDYRITDSWTDPPGQTEAWHSEILLRLPHGFLCYRPPADCGPVTQPPVTTGKPLTFGSFNALPKTTRRVVALWSSILTALPDARLILKNKSFLDPGTRQRYQQLFMAHGIDPDRLDLLGWVSGVNAHMGLYGKIDIALDTFPYNGTTTTCEALWMGVPVLTQEGRAHVARVGASLLARIGLRDWITQDADEYVQRAVEFAQQPGNLATIRKDLRGRIKASTLSDGPGFARDMEQAYRSIWAEWCARQH